MDLRDDSVRAVFDACPGNRIAGRAKFLLGRSVRRQAGIASRSGVSPASAQPGRRLPEPAGRCSNPRGFGPDARRNPRRRPQRKTRPRFHRRPSRGGRTGTRNQPRLPAALHEARFTRPIGPLRGPGSPRPGRLRHRVHGRSTRRCTAWSPSRCWRRDLAATSPARKRFLREARAAAAHPPRERRRTSTPSRSSRCLTWSWSTSPGRTLQAAARRGPARWNSRTSSASAARSPTDWPPPTRKA